VAVPRSVAVDPEIVVPLQIGRPHFVDEPRELVHEPAARALVGKADLRRLGAILRDAGVVAAIARREPAFIEPVTLHVLDRRPLGLDPQTEQHSHLLDTLGDGAETRWKTSGVGVESAET